MSYKIFENIFDDDFSQFIKDNARVYHPGRVGKRINLKQKNRSDSYLKDPNVLNLIDDRLYNVIYEDVKTVFGHDIKYREPYKVGYYDGENGGFYNLHTDDARETKYRCISMVAALSDPEEYGGGILYFSNLNKEFKLKKNSAIVFDSSILHGVKPVTSGKRHVLISFFFNDNGKTVRETLNPSLINNKHWDDQYKPLLSNIQLDYTNVEVAEIGDKDYSDFNKHDWTDQDDFFFQDNDSDTLFVSFAGMGWKESIPTFNFYNFMKKYNNVDKLFLRDTGPPNATAWACRYYLLGMRHNTNSLEKSIEFIRNKFLSKKNYKRVVGFGCSAGGFAAILYGSHLKFDKIIAFNPQTNIGQYKDDVMKDEYNAPRTCRYLRNQRKDSEFYQNSLDLKTLQPFSSKIFIHYSDSSNRGCDKLHAEYLDDDENVNIIEHVSNSHLLALDLKNNGELEKIIEDALFT